MEVLKSSNVIKLIKRDPVFSISLILALLSCILSKPRIDYINFEVLICLFNLMVVVKALEELCVLDKVAVSILNRCTDNRKVSLVMVLLSFFSSMLITNDVALITLVPLTLIISRKSEMDMLFTIILQTLAANIGSSLTPIGNPQNLYIFSYYKLTANQFFSTMIFIAISGLLWLYLLNIRNPKAKYETNLEPVDIKDRKKVVIWLVLFIIIILSVFHIIKYETVLIIILILTLIINKSILLKVDFLLLATFVCFFIFIGNISSISVVAEFMKQNLNSPRNTYFSSILLSQLISNVPCAIFLSKFTSYWKELLLGVNIGGMGTIIASLASVISYKLFIKDNPECNRKYISLFTLYNVLSLGLFTFINYVLVIKR